MEAFLCCVTRLFIDLCSDVYTCAMCKAPCRNQWLALPGLRLYRLFHDHGAALDPQTDFHGELMRQHVGDPDEPALAHVVGKHLERGVVMHELHARLNDGISQPARLVIHGNDQFTHHTAVCKCEYPSVSLDVRRHDIARREAPMHRTDVAHRLPYLFWRRLDYDIFTNGSYGSIT